MKEIFKYPITVVDDQEIEMPMDAEIIHAGLDPKGNACVWAKVSSYLKKENFRIHVRGTGHVIHTNARHIGSFVSGPFVWHVFTS